MVLLIDYLIDYLIDCLIDCLIMSYLIRTINGLLCQIIQSIDCMF